MSASSECQVVAAVGTFQQKLIRLHERLRIAICSSKYQQHMLTGSKQLTSDFRILSQHPARIVDGWIKAQGFGDTELHGLLVASKYPPISALENPQQDTAKKPPPGVVTLDKQANQVRFKKP